MSEQNPLEAPSKNPFVWLKLIVKQLFKKGNTNDEDTTGNGDPDPRK